MRRTRVAAFGVLAFSVGLAAAAQEVASLRMEIGPSTLSGGETGKGRITVATAAGAPPSHDVRILLSSNNPGLVRFVSEEIQILARQGTAIFEFGTASTPINTSVAIVAAVEGRSPRDEKTVSLVPALLRRVTAAGPSLAGTFGQSLNVTAELKAPAPAGGIELYLSPYQLPNGGGRARADATLPSNPRVAAGSKTVTFSVPYENVLRYYSDTSIQSTAFDVNFETQTRRIEQIVAVEPQTSKVWVTVPDRALKFGFDLVPLRASSVSVQPTTGAQGSEALATFQLTAPPGNGERVHLSGGLGARVVLIGSSCQAASSVSSIEMVLSPGVTTHTFKVCPRSVTSTTATNIRVNMRSGSFQTPFTTTP